MNKKDFIEYVAINSDIPKASAIAIVDIFTNSLQEVIVTGESITIDEIGEFQTKPLFSKELSIKHFNKIKLAEIFESKTITFTTFDELKTLASRNVATF